MIRVLAIFANPKGSDPVRLGEEERVMKECIALCKNRNQIQLETRHAATVDDFSRALLASGSFIGQEPVKR